ncbi:MAG: hypothetical protein ICV65_11850 [Flavisolibacter sp.]|nr:hypothetical protein [Flavisolibacter sp.]
MFYQELNCYGLFVGLLIATNIKAQKPIGSPIYSKSTVAIRNSAGNEKVYCSPYTKTKYKIQILRNKITITRMYKEYKDVFMGTIKNGKIYSNDPNERNVKQAWGKYYKPGKDNFSILNIENGEYEWFYLCTSNNHLTLKK